MFISTSPVSKIDFLHNIGDNIDLSNEASSIFKLRAFTVLKIVK